MANNVICAELDSELEIDLSCLRDLTKKYFQEIVVMNFADIDRAASTINLVKVGICDYSVSLVLLEGKKGVMIKLPDSSSTIKGTYSKSMSDLGYPQYIHMVQFLMAGFSSVIKCAMDKLDRGAYVVAAQAKSGEVEIYGYVNGLYTNDYTWDPVDGGGGTIIILQSRETEQEGTVPLLYKPAVGGSANADFNEQFAQPIVP